MNITGSDGASHSITLGLADLTDNITNLAATINAAGYGITASVAVGTLTFTSASPTASVSGANLTDTVLTPDAAPTATPTGIAQSAAGSIGTVNMTNATDVLTGGTLSITGPSGTAKTFTLGKSGTTDNLANLVKTINNWAAGGGAGAGITAVLTNATTLTINSAGGGGAAPTALTLVGGASDSVAAVPTLVSITGTPTVNTPSSSTIGTLALGGAGASVTDVLNGTLTIGTHTITLGGTGTTDTLQDLAKTINAGDYGVTANYSQTNKNIVFTSSNSALTASYLASAGSGDQTTATATVAYTPAAPVSTAEDYYSVGISNALIQDINTQMLIGGVPTYGGTTNTGLTMDINSAGQIATIGYTDAAGTSLAGTSLADQQSAQAALNLLNVAISDVAAMDGYIGAQINTLNSISQVMSTQQENVVSAQNAIQATDYAAATSNMSKYEILTQTGIAALAQANSIQQEVTKLLQ